MACCRSLLIVLTGVLLVALPISGAADPDPSCKTRSIAVVFVGENSPSFTDFRHEVEELVSREPCYRLLDSVLLLEAGMSRPHASLDRGLDLLERGLSEAEAMRLEAALPLLHDAVEALGEAFGLLPSPKPLVEALLALGGTLAATGDFKGAREFLTGAFHLDPNARIETVMVLPEALRAQEITRNVMAVGRTGSLLVDSTPPGAEVYIDGVYRGPAPWDEPNLPAGLHFVTLRMVGFERKSIAVRVPDGGSIAITGAQSQLEPARRRPLWETARTKLLRSGPHRDSSGGIDDLKALFLTDLLLVVDVLPSESHATLWDLQTMDGIWRSSSEGGLEGSPAIRGAAVNMVMSAFRSDRARFQVAEGTAAAPRGRPSIASRWWFWTTIGVVVVGAVTTGVLLGRSGPDHPDGLPKDGNTGSVVIRF